MMACHCEDDGIGLIMPFDAYGGSTYQWKGADDV